ncbi:MAG TPA: AraC family transcriptional regulator [Desulfobacterales bacterium]|nr:AraC family transcriptional regulator [Desulfobacterales bacterium]
MQKTHALQLSEYFPEVQEFSHSKTNSAKPFIPSFEDKNWTSILYIERGNFQIRYETGEVLKAKGGTFYYHPPLSLKYQTFDKTITPYSMYHLAVDLSLSDLSLFASHSAEQQIIKQLPGYPFVRTAPPSLISSFKTIMNEYDGKQLGYLAQIANSIRQILISSVRSELEQNQPPAISRKYVKKIDIFLDDNIDFMGPVEHLFDLMGVSRSRGYDIFHQNFGLTPKEYLLRRKIILAKKMLQQNKAITSIAYELGFSSSQSFATTFKKLTCSTPSNYRKGAFKG